MGTQKIIFFPETRVSEKNIHLWICGANGHQPGSRNAFCPAVGDEKVALNALWMPPKRQMGRNVETTNGMGQFFLWERKT